MILSCTAERSGKLLSFLRRELRLSTAQVNRLKLRNAMFADGRSVHTDFPVAPGTVVSVCIEEDEPEYPAEAGELSVLYEDEAVIAVDKPSGMLVHPSRSRNTGTLANRLAYHYAQNGEKCAVHPVSRLDRDTFGVVLLAKNAHTHALLCRAQQEGKLEKIYQASVWGRPPEAEGLIDLPIARLDPMGMLRGVREDGKPAQTRYRVLAEGAHAALLELRPLTGRTHQLRVHLAAVGCPILGDPQYGSEESQRWSLACGISGQQLCACALTFPHPLTGARITLRSAQRVCFPQDETPFLCGFR